MDFFVKIPFAVFPAPQGLGARGGSCVEYTLYFLERSRTVVAVIVSKFCAKENAGGNPAAKAIDYDKKLVLENV